MRPGMVLVPHLVRVTSFHTAASWEGVMGREELPSISASLSADELDVVSSSAGEHHPHVTAVSSYTLTHH